MSHSATTPIPLLKSIAAFIDLQDGSQTWKQQLPALISYLRTVRSDILTEDILSKQITSIFARVQRIRRRQQADRELAASYRQAEEERSVGRWTPLKQAAWARKHAVLIAEHKARKPITLNKHDTEEEKVVVAVEQARERGVEKRKQEMQAKQEADQHKRQMRQEEKKAAEQKTAEEKEAKAAEQAEKTKSKEQSKKRVRDMRASQLFDLKQERLSNSQRVAEDLRMDRELKRTLARTAAVAEIVLRAMAKELKVDIASEVASDSAMNGNKENIDPASDE